LLLGKRSVPAGAARRASNRAGTARSGQGRALLARRSEPLPASTVLASAATSTGGEGGNTFPLVSFERCSLDGTADDSGEANATIDQSDIRGSEPHGHDPSGAA